MAATQPGSAAYRAANQKKVVEEPKLSGLKERDMRVQFESSLCAVGCPFCVRKAERGELLLQF